VVEPVGSERPREIDVRVIGATNANLQERVAKGEFRDDLFYRLNVIPIRIPGLAERTEDIPVLVKEFVHRFAPDKMVTVSTELMDRLTGHAWPGNIRELENRIERMGILRTADKLTAVDLPDDFSQPMMTANTLTASGANGRMSFHEAEEQMVREALDRCGWNRTKAAEYLNVPRHVLVYRMKKYDIKQG
jgi:two-component system NtrC family response regulator